MLSEDVVVSVGDGEVETVSEDVFETVIDDVPVAESVSLLRVTVAVADLDVVMVPVSEGDIVDVLVIVMVWEAVPFDLVSDRVAVGTAVLDEVGEMVSLLVLVRVTESLWVPESDRVLVAVSVKLRRVFEAELDKVTVLVADTLAVLDAEELSVSVIDFVMLSVAVSLGEGLCVDDFSIVTELVTVGLPREGVRVAVPDNERVLEFVMEIDVVVVGDGVRDDVAVAVSDDVPVAVPVPVADCEPVAEPFVKVGVSDVVPLAVAVSEVVEVTVPDLVHVEVTDGDRVSVNVSEVVNEVVPVSVILFDAVKESVPDVVAVAVLVALCDCVIDCEALVV